jgi:hypothetical protein
MKPLFCLATTVLALAVLWGVCRADEQREEKPRFKGVELYSWKNKGGDWQFVLLNGTNRLKTEAEVKSAKTKVKGAEELKQALARLVVGEQVFWTHPISGFEYPAPGMRQEIAKAAKEAQIDLKTPSQEK